MKIFSYFSVAMLVVASFAQAASAGTPAAPELDMNMLGGIITVAAAGYVAIKNFSSTKK